MFTKKSIVRFFILLFAILLISGTASASPLKAPLGTGFTYQGRLLDGGLPANGAYDLEFTLFDSLSGGSQVGSTLTQPSVTVTNGQFAVQLDFGAVFDGTALYLEIGVRPGGSSVSYTTLTPRQLLSPTPYALFARNAALLNGLNAASYALAGHNHWGETWTGSGTGLTLSGGNIGLSGSGSAYGMYGTSSSTNGTGVYGSGNIGVSGTSTTGNGVYGMTSTSIGFGVSGYNNGGGTGVNGEGGTYGVFGISTTGTGVHGLGATYGISGDGGSSGTGVYGTSSTNVGLGVLGANSGGGTGVYGDGLTGVYGFGNGLNSTGVYGTSPLGAGVSGSGATYGVSGDGGTTGTGVYGTTSNSSGYGVSGTNTGTTGTGVYGSGNTGVTGTSTAGNGVSGTTSNSSDYGVSGTNTGTFGTGVYGSGSNYGIGVSGSGNFGVYGSGNSHGVYGTSTNGSGVYGTSTNGSGVSGEATTYSGYGVAGINTSTDPGVGVYGSGAAYGVEGYSTAAGGSGVYGEAYYGSGGLAGLFDGNVKVNGNVDVYGAFYVHGSPKSAVVDTQDYGTRTLYAVESPENWFQDFGTGQLTNGSAVIIIDPVYAETVNLSDDYHVFFTPLGDCALYVTDKTPTSFTVKALGGQTCSIAFDYNIVAKRLGYENVRLAVADPLPTVGAPSK